VLGCPATELTLSVEELAAHAANSMEPNANGRSAYLGLRTARYARADRIETQKAAPPGDRPIQQHGVGTEGRRRWP